VQRTVPLTFTASETFDVGRDTMSPVADDYFDRAPFPFEGKLGQLHFKNLQDEKRPPSSARRTMIKLKASADGPLHSLVGRIEFDGPNSLLRIMGVKQN
jgi:hypothetical protein